jgi:protein-S-isoprenylcysteine O-methyltransferase Ste14
VASWTRIARRIRVPVGFLFTAFYIWLARASWAGLAGGSVIVMIGVGLRAYASGYLRKANQLTTAGPYAYTRNPLYLGSMIMAGGFAFAARNLWIALAMIVIFAAIYLPVIASEEEFLRSHFEGFDAYARRVPRLLPRLSPAAGACGEFSLELYLKHREYNSALGAAAIMAALIFKLVWLSR